MPSEKFTDKETTDIELLLICVLKTLNISPVSLLAIDGVVGMTAVRAPSVPSVPSLTSAVGWPVMGHNYVWMDGHPNAYIVGGHT